MYPHLRPNPGICVVFCLVLTGCSEIEWFPESPSFTNNSAPFTNTSSSFSNQSTVFNNNSSSFNQPEPVAATTVVDATNTVTVTNLAVTKFNQNSTLSFFNINADVGNTGPTAPVTVTIAARDATGADIPLPFPNLQVQAAPGTTNMFLGTESLGISNAARIETWILRGVSK